MSVISENKDIIINRFKMLKDEGTAMTEAVAIAGADVPASAGLYPESLRRRKYEVLQARLPPETEL